VASRHLNQAAEVIMRVVMRVDLFRSWKKETSMRGQGNTLFLTSHHSNQYVLLVSVSIKILWMIYAEDQERRGSKCNSFLNYQIYRSSHSRDIEETE
jgi:hypothetical protein